MCFMHLASIASVIQQGFHKATSTRERLSWPLLSFLEETMKYLDRPWTKEEVDYLIAHADRYSAREIGRALNRSKSSVIGKRNRLGLAKSKWEPQQPEVRHVYLEEYLTGNGKHQLKYKLERDQWRIDDHARARRAKFRVL